MLKTQTLSTGLGLLFVAAALLIPSAAHAQLQEVKQTVFGMDCAPCAHALETRLGDTEGVAEVSVSLNEGLATVELTPTNTLTLEAIRSAVTSSGFSPKDATVRLTGKLQQRQDQFVLTIQTGETYVLKSEDDGSPLMDVEEGQRLTVTGHVSEDATGENGWTLRVQRVHG